MKHRYLNQNLLEHVAVYQTRKTNSQQDQCKRNKKVGA